MRYDVSIIIPCYNEEENVEECVRKVREHNRGCEIIVVDDGSTDRTAEVAGELGVDGLKVVRYEKNHGKGYAFRTGLRHASGDIVVIQDADMATPPEELPDVLRPILEGRADYSNGTRLVYPMERGAMKRVHVFGNRIFALIVSMMVRKWLTDTLCGFKAFRKSVMRTGLREDSWPDFDIIFMAKKSGMRFAEVPIHYKRRTAGKSKMKTFSHAYKMFRMLARSLLKGL